MICCQVKQVWGPVKEDGERTRDKFEIQRARGVNSLDIPNKSSLRPHQGL